jgi:uncharacterized protein YecE (DUF72 family)
MLMRSEQRANEVPARISVGCSGYYYPQWKEHFYPVSLKPAEWLQHYSTVFNTVELNGTFYKAPTLSGLRKYFKTTPSDFKFSVKMNKYITHVQRLRDCAQQVQDFCKFLQDGLEDKLACVLFQMPPSFHYNPENLERIVNNVPHHPSSVVELRHASWWNSDSAKTFEKYSITFCNVDYPGLQTKFQLTSDLCYLRLHGSPELFKTSYTDTALGEILDNLPTRAGSYFIYFNNTFYQAAYRNAKTMMDMLRSKNLGIVQTVLQHRN